MQFLRCHSDSITVWIPCSLSQGSMSCKSEPQGANADRWDPQEMGKGYTYSSSILQRDPQHSSGLWVVLDKSTCSEKSGPGPHIPGASCAIPWFFPNLRSHCKEVSMGRPAPEAKQKGLPYLEFASKTMS